LCSSFEQLTSVLGNEGTEDEGSDSGELDENVDGRTGGILEWVSNGISDNGGGVLGVTLLDNSVLFSVGLHVEASLLGGEVVVSGESSGGIASFLDGLDVVAEHSLLGGSGSVELFGLNHLLAVIPGTTSVGGGESNLDTGNDNSGEESSGGDVSEDHADDEGGEDDDGTGGDHLGEGSLGGDGNALLVVSLGSSHNGGELSLDFLNHELSGITDGTHGEGGEPVREHRSEKEAGEGVGVEDINLDLDSVGLSDSGDEGTEEGEGDKGSGSNGESFTDSGSGVTGGIELVSGFTDRFLEVGHLGNTSGVIGDGTVSVNGEGDGEASEHTNGRKGNSVHGGEVEGNEDGGTEADNWDDVGHVSEGESLDDIGSGSVFARLGEVLDGAVMVGGVVLSGGSNDHTGPESHHDATVKFPVGGVVDNSSEGHIHGDGEHVHGGDDGNGHEDGGDNELVEELGINFLLESSAELAEEGHDNTDGGDNDGEVDGVSSLDHREAGGGDDESGASRFSERSEEISSHSSDITDIVTDVIGNSSGVSGRIFLKSVSDFTGKIGTDISSFGVDTTTDSSEESDGGATETVSGKVLEEDSDLSLDGFTSSLGLIGVRSGDDRWLVGEDEDFHDDEGESNESESEDLSTSEGSVESSVFVLGGAEVGGLDVTDGSDLHSDETASHGGDRSDEEGEGGVREPHNFSSFVSFPGHVDGADEDDSEDGAEDGQVGVFLDQESVGAIFDTLIDFFHEFEARLIGPGEERVSCHLLLIGDVDDVLDGLELDFVDLNSLEDTPDETEDTTSKDDVMSVGALNSCCSG